MTAQNGRTAAAAGASGVDVLAFIKHQNTAIFVKGIQPDPLFLHQIIQQPRADAPQIPRKDRVIILGGRLRRCQIAEYGVRRSRC